MFGMSMVALNDPKAESAALVRNRLVGVGLFALLVSAGIGVWWKMPESIGPTPAPEPGVNAASSTTPSTGNVAPRVTQETVPATVTGTGSATEASLAKSNGTAPTIAPSSHRLDASSASASTPADRGESELAKDDEARPSDDSAREASATSSADTTAPETGTSDRATGDEVQAQGAPAGPQPESTIALARSPVTAAPTSPVPFKDWTQLRYTTSKMIFLTGEVKMLRTVVGNKITMRTETQARLFGAPFVNAWSLASKDRATGRPLEFLDVRPGKRAERWTFNDHSIVCTVLKPSPKQKNAPIEAWKVTKTRTFPIKDTGPTTGMAATQTQHLMNVSLAASATGGNASPASKPSPRDPSRWVYDYMTMVASLGDFGLYKVGDIATALVSTSDGPVPVTIRVAQERTTRRNLTDLTTGKSRSVDLREFRLSVSPPAGSPAQKEDYLKGDTELWVEASTRTFTQLSGRFSGVPGKIDLVLAGYR